MTRVASFKQSGFIRRAVAPGKTQRGVALLEVLIAFFVLSIGLLGLAGMQINQASFQRSQAMISAYDMLDRMRLNQSEATGGNYDMAWGNSSSGSGVVGDDLSQWLDTISSNFPDGQGSIECDANDICTVGVRWRDRFGANPGTDWESLAISSQL